MSAQMHAWACSLCMQSRLAPGILGPLLEGSTFLLKACLPVSTILLTVSVRDFVSQPLPALRLVTSDHKVLLVRSFTSQCTYLASAELHTCWDLSPVRLRRQAHRALGLADRCLFARKLMIVHGTVHDTHMLCLHPCSIMSSLCAQERLGPRSDLPRELHIARDDRARIRKAQYSSGSQVQSALPINLDPFRGLCVRR